MDARLQGEYGAPPEGSSYRPLFRAAILVAWVIDLVSSQTSCLVCPTKHPLNLTKQPTSLDSAMQLYSPSLLS